MRAQLSQLHKTKHTALGIESGVAQENADQGENSEFFPISTGGFEVIAWEMRKECANYLSQEADKWRFLRVILGIPVTPMPRPLLDGQS